MSLWLCLKNGYRTLYSHLKYSKLIASFFSNYKKLFDNAESSLACMEELGINEDFVQEMEDADEPNDDYSCFFGCYLLKENIVSIFI